MNFSELARRLNVSPNYLRDTLPKIGFDVGRKAIKVDDRVANTIIQKWSTLLKELEDRATREKQAMIEEAIQAAPKEVLLPSVLTVRELAQALHLSLPLLMTELMKNGVLASVNERLDFETASIIAEDLGFTVKSGAAEASGEGTEVLEAKLKAALGQAKHLRPRPPVVVVMGHVDHGKTKLLDTIRQTNVVEAEAGGITQHIGAYQVEKKRQLITFIDTPGHEAFRAMRSRGARVADIAILVVAADDGFKPQTHEALSIIQGATLPFIVAINKIDKPEADVEKVKQELGSLNLIPEEWGGHTIVVPISAKTGEGINHLLEVILLVAELHRQDIVADPAARAFGTVIEAHVDPGAGPVATLLVQNGTIRINDPIVRGDVLVGKARVLKDHRAGVVIEALPAMPIRILGLREAPEVGDILEVAAPRETYKLAGKKKHVRRSSALDFMIRPEDDDAVQRQAVPVLLKADMLGSLEAIMESLAKIEHPEVGVQVISKGLGNITETDIIRADASQALVAGFHVSLTREAGDLAREKGVDVKLFDVIYDLLADVKKRLIGKLSPEIILTELGRGTVLAVFRQEPKWQIVGVRVSGGLVEERAHVRILRHGEHVGEGIVERLQAGQETIREAAAGAECGVQIATSVKLAAGDLLEFYREEEKARTIQ